MQTAIITGPTGVLGAALSRSLIAEGVTVIALVRPGSRRVVNLPQSDKALVVECGLDQLSDAATLVRLHGIESCDVWFHLGWSSTFGVDARNDTNVQVANIGYSLDAVSAADELGCGVFVGVGSQAEFGRHEHPMGPDTPTFPENGYGVAKLAAGAMTRIECGKRGIRHEWVRVFSVYGPYDNPNTLVSSTLRTLLQGEVPHVTLGEQFWDYIFADDAARALNLVARFGKDGATYCLGSGSSRPLRSCIEELRDAVDGSLSVGFGDIPYSPKQVMFLQADISSLVEDTGFKAQVTFEEGIKKTVAWMRGA